MSRGRTGTLVIIGGHENKDDDPLILKEVVRRVENGKLVVATVASELPEEMWADYERVFRRLGVKHLYKLDVESREDAFSDRKVQILADADAVFFTGGDQLKITTLLGASPLCERLREIYHDEGGMICGTSAGASVMSDTMLVGGGDEGSARIGRTVRMAPGLALVSDVLIDQHFAERGRVGRLLGAVAQNPRLLGIGIDENTAIVMEGSRQFQVLGEGAVYVFNAWDMTYANLTEESRDRALSMFGTRIDVLSQGDSYDMRSRTPTNHPAHVVEEQLETA
jgi:cyanophycinase